MRFVGVDQFTGSTWLIMNTRMWDQEQDWRTLDYNFIVTCFRLLIIQLSQICNGLAKLGKKNYKTGILTSLVSPLCYWFKVVGNFIGWMSLCFGFVSFTCVRQVVILGNIVSRLNFGSNFFANNLHFIILIVKIRIIWFLYDQPWQMSSRIFPSWIETFNPLNFWT